MRIFRTLCAIAVATFVASGAVADDAQARNVFDSCKPLGAITLNSASGVRIEVDGENAGCNAAGNRYSFGNILGDVRVSKGLPYIWQPESLTLTMDEPLEFVRRQNPLRGGNLLKGTWMTREGHREEMSFRQPGIFSAPDSFVVDEFVVYAANPIDSAETPFYHEWGQHWTVAAPLNITGRVLMAVNGNRPIDNVNEGFPDVQVDLYFCRSRDGLAATTRTDLAGAYSFNGVEDGYYQLRYYPPAGWVFPAPDGTAPFAFENGFSSCVDYVSRNTLSIARNGLFRQVVSPSGRTGLLIRE